MVTALALPSVAAADTQTFDYPFAIVIPTQGNASPYPSTIGVSGFVGPVGDVNVTIKNLQHPVETDLSILLVGPGGQSTILASQAGSSPSSSTPDETFTLDDESAASLTCGSLSPVPPGSYKPTRGTCNGGNPEAFGPPAPSGPYPVSLSVFDGTTANGNWNLFVRDEFAADAGTIGGWSLTIASPVIASPAVTTPTDSTTPETTITKRPKNRTTKKTATFGFTSSEAGSTFECRLDRNLGFSPCASPKTVLKVGRGKHSFEVRAKDRAGNTDATPASDQWKVTKKKRKHRKSRLGH